MKKTTWNKEAEIKRVLRRLAKCMPEKRTALRMAVNPCECGPRGGVRYICAKCGLTFDPKEVQVDHIEPVEPTDRDEITWDEYIERLFCDVDNLQVLCKECHQIKTNDENNERRSYGLRYS